MSSDGDILVCPYCYSEVKKVGEDGIDTCPDGCGIIEGSAITVTEDEINHYIEREVS